MCMSSGVTTIKSSNVGCQKSEIELVYDLAILDIYRKQVKATS